MVLTKEQIDKADDLPREEVQTPEWGGSVFVKTMTGKERDRWELDVETHEKQGNVRASIAVVVICDEEGNLLYTPDDASKLAEKSSKVLDRIFAVAKRLNGMSEDDVEELEANFCETPPDVSSSV